MRTVSPDENPLVAQTVDHVGRLARRRFERVAIAHELDADEQSRAAHIADERTPIDERSQLREEVGADLLRMRLHPFVFEHVEHGQSDGARDGVAAERAEVLHPVVERRGYLRRRHHGADRMPIADRLAQHHDVRHHLLLLEAVEM